MAKDYYDVLGVEPNADVIVIKRRYRQLVRQYHPDIATNREAAHELMLAINEAWTILSDPAERARYDRSRHQTTSSAGTTSTNGPTRVDGWVGGAASTPGGRPATASRPASPPTAPRSTGARGSTTRTRLLTMVFEAAELYFFHGRATEAIEMCQKVMKYDANNAEAPALLGDIYAEQGKKADAIAMYERAVRNQPTNNLYKQKLTALGGSIPTSGEERAQTPPVRKPPTSSRGPRPGGLGSKQGGLGSRIPPPSSAPMSGASSYAAAVASTGAGVRENGVSQQTRRKMASVAKSARRDSLDTQNETVRRSSPVPMQETPGKTQATIGFLLISGATAIVIWNAATSNTGARPANNLADIDVNTLVLTSLAAALLGLSLPLLGLVQRCGRVGRGEPQWLGGPFLALLLVAGLIWSPAAVILFLAVAFISRTWPRSVFIVMVLAGVWSALLAVNRPEDASLLPDALLTWSGRAIFPAMVIGWMLGSPRN